MVTSLPQELSATSPQLPIARGPYDSVILATTEARRCGVTKLRMEIGPEKSALFLDGEVEKAMLDCFSAWMTLRGRTLQFDPRWWNDDFTKERP
jgi:hypothetical protein